MADFFDYIPALSVILLTLGLIGALVYERSRSKTTDAKPS